MVAKRVTFSSGHSLVVSHNLDSHEMVRTLAALARAQRVDAELGDRLRKSEAPESPEPEMFMDGIVKGLREVYKTTVATLLVNIERWARGQTLAKAMNQPPLVLTQEQVDELVALVRAHFQVVVRIGRPAWNVPVDYERRWRDLGLIPPSVFVGSYVRDAFVAGKLNEVLTTNSSFDQMRFAARGIQMTRAERLTLDAVQREAALWFLQPVNQLAEDVAFAAQNRTNEVVRDIVGRYMSGQLRSTSGDVSGLTATELSAVEGSQVMGWKGLARELRNRIGASDAGRDWDRVAATESRYAYNMGRLTDFQARGIPVIEWKVQPDACPYCRELLLNPDGTPRRFTMEFVQTTLRETSGMNYGRRASRIGRDGGWLPTAVIHPWCRCTPFPAGVLE